MLKNSSISKILITGASGFVGTHLAKYLADQGYEIHSCVRQLEIQKFGLENKHVCSLENIEELEALFHQIQPQILIHLASRAIPNRQLDDLEVQYRETVLPSISLAKAAPTSLKLAIFTGSCEEYGNGIPPFQENQALRVISPYGWAKASAFHAVSMIAQQRRLPYCWLRPFLMFGSGQKTDQLIPTVIVGCLKDREIPLTYGQQTRDFLFVEDFCFMIGKIINGSPLAIGETLNLCSGVPRTIRSVAELIQKSIGTGKLDFGRISYRFNEAMSFYGSPDRFISKFGKLELTRLELALDRTIQSYAAQLEKDLGKAA